jgi:hypothetical protein
MNAQAAQMMGYVNEMLTLIGGNLHSNEGLRSSAPPRKAISHHTPKKPLYSGKGKKSGKKLIPMDHDEEDFTSF